MSTDRLIIFAAVVGVVLSLAGASLLVQPINAARLEHQLSANENLMENMPPQYALPYMALAAFRGVILNVLWIRIEQMKQDGKFWEVMQLAEMITKLQPRSPHVWANRAWNNSYNISVATHTEQERWMWVKSGVDLLRDEGIPNNPNAILLYKELSWIFLHKIGMDSDDLHRYYKAALAFEWHLVLGEPAVGYADLRGPDGKVILDEQGQPRREYAAIAAFRPIAWMYDRYLNSNFLSLKGQQELRKLLADPEMRDDVQEFAELPVPRMIVKLQRLHEKLNRNEPKYAARLKPLLDELEDQRRRTVGDPVKRFREGEGPEVARLLDELASLGFAPDEKLVDRVGRLRALADSDAAYLLGIEKKALESESSAEAKLRELFADAKVEGAPATILAFARARVLSERYHMNPLWMLELMEGRWFVHPDQLADLEARDEIPAIPLDWRHPAAHGLYWAALGVKKSQGLIKPEDFDLLNTDRQILHGLQQMLHRGKYVFDPVSQHLQAVPDVNYIDAYHYAVLSAAHRIISERVKGSAAIDSFEAGHENFLIWAVQNLYFAGMTAKAEKYYATARSLFGFREPKSPHRYSKPLATFVNDEFVDAEAITDKEAVSGFVHYMLQRAINEGYVANRPDVASRFMRSAKQVYDAFQNAQDYRTLEAFDRVNRMALEPFNTLVVNAFKEFLSSPGPPETLLVKSRIWRNLSEPMRRRLYDAVYPRVRQVAEGTNLEVDLAFPEPPGMAEYRESLPNFPKGRDDKEDLFVSAPVSGQR